MAFVAKLVFSLLLAFALALWWHEQRSHQASLYDEWIAEAATKWDLDSDLIRAVIWRETNFDPTKLGSAQERGLMQVTPVAAEEWAKSEKIKKFQVEQLAHPRTGIMAGCWYLQRALKRWKDRDDPVPFALAEYNAGRSNALRWAASEGVPLGAQEFIERISFPSTKAYVQTILSKMEDYRSQSRLGLDSLLVPEVKATQ